MNNSPALLVLTGLLALYGGFTFLKGVRSVRARREYPGALTYWEEPAAQGFGRDPGGSLAVLIHRLALILVGIIAIAGVLQRPAIDSVLPLSLNWPGLLMDFVLVCAAGILGFTWGVSFFGPLAERLGGEHHYAITADGIIVGGSLLPWSCFSHFTLETERNLVYIWSAFLRGAPAMVAAPSEPGAAVRLAAILREHLPDSDPARQAPRGTWTLAVRMALLCAPFIAVAWWLASSPLMIMMSLDAVLMWLLQLLGATLIGQLLYGNRMVPVPAMP